MSSASQALSQRTVLFSKQSKNCSVPHNKNNENLNIAQMMETSQFLELYFYSSPFLLSIQCIIDDLLYDIENGNVRISENLKLTRKINTDSNYGSVYRSKLDKLSDVFVIKTLQSVKLTTSEEEYIEASQSLTHESYIALMGLNKLRTKIPNFSIVFGYFECSQMKKCSKPFGVNVPYAIYEFIKGHPFDDYIEIAPEKYIYSALYSIFIALRIAYIEYEFSHNDLHFGNILVRGFTDKSKMPIICYQPIGEGRYLELSGVPTFIDYGLSQAKIDGKLQTKFGVKSFQIDSKRSSPVKDIFCVLNNTHHIVKKYDELKEMRIFLSLLIEKLGGTTDKWYIMKNEENLFNYKLADEIIELVYEKCLQNGSIVQKIDYNSIVLECDDNCKSTKSILNDYYS